jgi:hypothetical protein
MEGNKFKIAIILNQNLNKFSAVTSEIKKGKRQVVCVHSASASCKMYRGYNVY